jgi:hypothetical protein
MADPFRPPLWRRAWVAVIAAFVGMAGLVVLAQHLISERREALRAQTPEIITATYLGTGAIIERRFQPRAGKAVFVRLEDGSQKMFRFSEPDHRLEGCKIGGRIALERRGLVVSIAKTPCPDSPDNVRSAVQK